MKRRGSVRYKESIEQAKDISTIVDLADLFMCVESMQDIFSNGCCGGHFSKHGNEIVPKKWSSPARRAKASGVWCPEPQVTLRLRWSPRPG